MPLAADVPMPTPICPIPGYWLPPKFQKYYNKYGRDLPDLVDLMETPVPDMLPLLWMLCLFIVKVNLFSAF